MKKATDVLREEIRALLEDQRQAREDFRHTALFFTIPILARGDVEDVEPETEALLTVVLNQELK